METIQAALDHKDHIKSYKIMRAYDDYKKRDTISQLTKDELDELYAEALVAFAKWLPANSISQIDGAETYDNHSHLLEAFKRAEPPEIDTFILTKQVRICSESSARYDLMAYEASQRTPKIRGEYETYKRDGASAFYEMHRYTKLLDAHLAKFKA